MTESIAPEVQEAAMSAWVAFEGFAEDGMTAAIRAADETRGLKEEHETGMENGVRYHHQRLVTDWKSVPTTVLDHDTEENT